MSLQLITFLNTRFLLRPLAHRKDAPEVYAFL